MRDPNRIDPFLEKLGELWKKYPDQRFGQLIMNLSRGKDGSFQDTWGWEEDRWLEEILMADFLDSPDPAEIKQRALEFIEFFRGNK